jgi:hypothetical protein
MLCAALAAALLVAGCGGDDDGGGGGLSSDEKLATLQARADVADFCSVHKSNPSELFDRTYETLLTAVRDLAQLYADNPDATLEIPVEKKSLTMQQLVQEQAKALRKCGREGRQQAGVLQAALQQQSS